MSQDDSYSNPDSELHSAEGSGIIQLMPNVVGTDLPNARALLQQLGFVVNVIDEEVTDMLAGIVIAQNPAEGIPLEVGEPVDLTVSRVRPHPFPDSTPPPPPTEPIPS